MAAIEWKPSGVKPSRFLHALQSMILTATERGCDGRMFVGAFIEENCVGFVQLPTCPWPGSEEVPNGLPLLL